MELNELFQKFQDRFAEIKSKTEQLDSDYIEFIKTNREGIKKRLPKNGEIVEYTGEIERWRTETWKYLKVTDNRVIAKIEYGSKYIPHIGVIPLDEHYTPLQSYNERIPANFFKRREIEKQNKTALVGFIYVIRIEETNIFKIGFSADPVKRINTLRTSNPMQIVVQKIYKCYDALKNEGLLHGLFRDKKKNREWFFLDDNDLSRLELELSANIIHAYQNELEIKMPKLDSNLDMKGYEIEKGEIKEQFSDLKKNL